MLMLSPASVSHMTGCWSASAFCTLMLSMSSGSRRVTRDTRSRTSFAASSSLRVRLNSTVIDDWPSRDDDRMVLTPSMPESSPSSTCVTRVSTISDDAPG